nr:MAG TPA: hypothetical protein [Caudoviricetes sp.]
MPFFLVSCELNKKLVVCIKTHLFITRIIVTLLNYSIFNSQLYYNIHTIILQHLIH